MVWSRLRHIKHAHLSFCLEEYLNNMTTEEARTARDETQTALQRRAEFGQEGRGYARRAWGRR